MAQGLSDLLVTAGDAVDASRTGFPSLVAQARQRAAERARDALDGAATPSRAGDRVPRPAPPRPVPELSKASPAAIRLADGRRLQAAIDPPPALRSDLEAVARASTANDRATHAALDAQATQIESLKRAQAELAQKMDALQQQADRMLLGLFEGLSGLERKVETAAARGQALAAQSRATSALAARQAEEVRALSLSSQIDKVSAVVNTVQSVAYGQSGSPLAPNNVALAANQLFWTFLEPLLKGFGIVSGSAASVVTWLAPLGTLLTGQLVLSDRQHVRFLSGVSTFEGKSVVFESLHDRVAPGFREELDRRDLGVTVTPVTPTTSTFRGLVRNGLLVITRSGGGEAPPPARVAWVVDLGADIG